METDKNTSRVQIGYLEKSEPSKLKSRFFPNKVGGKPAWLDLKNISIDISCGVCSKPCIFLCQLYAPFDDLDRAYHRTIYIFICKNPECCLTNENNNFKVFRCQLPEVNDYYSTEEANGLPESTVDQYNTTCFVCGCLSSYKCAKCKKINYCSKEHQVFDWKAGHNLTCESGDNASSSLLFLFPEFEILTEPEDLEDDESTAEETEKSDDESTDGETEKSDDESTTKKTEKSEKDRIKEYKKLVEQGKAGTLNEVPPEVFEEFVCGVKKNKYLENFKTRLQKHPYQVIRYDLKGQPLYVSAPDSSKFQIPNCEYCQGPREFEFQVLSTLLSYLNVDSVDNSIDWGTLLVYTCKNSCGGSPSYKNEFLVKQDFT